MMKETSLEARVTKAGEAVGEGVQSATAATATAAGQAEKLVQDATASTLVAAGRVKKVLDDVDEAAQHAYSQAGGVAEDVVDAGRRATSPISRQIGQNPMISVLVSCAVGYVAGWWIHGRR